jgi:tetratricopeptide (TPR) repeat protein
MKKFFLIISSFYSFASIAQNIKVEDAAIYLRTLESSIEDAKKAIDEAAINPETKDDPKMWFMRAAVYDTIYSNPAFANIDKDVVEKYAIACKKCVDLDTKKKYNYYCLNRAILNSAFGAYNKAIEYYNSKDYPNSLKFFGYVMDVITNYDKDRVLAKNNITEKSIILTMADISIKSNNKSEAKKYLQKLIDMDYDNHVIYALMSNIHLEEKDTTKALSYIDLGRKRFPSEKDLISMELFIYQTQGKTDALLKKYDEALELNPENTLFLYNRAATYDNIIRSLTDRSNHLKDTAQKINNFAKNEKVIATKSKLNNASKQYIIISDSLHNVAKVYTIKAETDYNKAIEVNPDYLDAYYNLGALTNNKTTEVVEKMNALKTSSPDYDKKFSSLKKVQDSILYVALKHFNKALELTNTMPEKTEDERAEKVSTISNVLMSIQLVYANLGDEKKTIEFKNKRMVNELPGKSKSKLIALMGEPKNITKSKSDTGSVLETWTYDGLTVTMVDGKVSDVVQIVK